MSTLGGRLGIRWRALLELGETSRLGQENKRTSGGTGICDDAGGRWRGSLKVGVGVWRWWSRGPLANAPLSIWDGWNLAGVARCPLMTAQAEAQR